MRIEGENVGDSTVKRIGVLIPIALPFVLQQRLTGNDALRFAFVPPLEFLPSGF